MTWLFNVSENMTNVVQVITTSNTFVDGAMGIAILLMVFFGVLFISSAFSVKEQFVSSSFVAMVVAIFLRFMDLVDDYVMWLFEIIFISVIVWAFSTRTGGTGA